MSQVYMPVVEDPPEVVLIDGVCYSYSANVLAYATNSWSDVTAMYDDCEQCQQADNP